MVSAMAESITTGHLFQEHGIKHALRVLKDEQGFTKERRGGGGDPDLRSLQEKGSIAL